MAYDELTARLAKQASQLEQALAKKGKEIAQAQHAYQSLQDIEALTIQLAMANKRLAELEAELNAWKHGL